MTISSFLLQFIGTLPTLDISEKSATAECRVEFCTQVSIGMNDAIIGFYFDDITMRPCYLVADDSDGYAWDHAHVGPRPHFTLRIVQAA